MLLFDMPREPEEDEESEEPLEFPAPPFMLPHEDEFDEEEDAEFDENDFS